MPSNGGVWGLENPHYWVVCRKHGCKFPACCRVCPICLYGPERAEGKVRDLIPGRVVPTGAGRGEA